MTSDAYRGLVDAAERGLATVVGVDKRRNEPAITEREMRPDRVSARIRTRGAVARPGQVMSLRPS